jgi:hypothetical protein
MIGPNRSPDLGKSPALEIPFAKQQPPAGVISAGVALPVSRAGWIQWPQGAKATLDRGPSDLVRVGEIR